MDRREFLMSSAGFIGALLLRPLLPTDYVITGVSYPAPLDKAGLFDKFLAESCVKPTYVFCHPDILAELEAWDLWEASQDQPDTPRWFPLTYHNQSD